MKSNRYADFSSSRRLWNQFFSGAVWVAAVFVIILVVGIIGMVLIRGLPHVNWTFLTTTSSILRGTNGILPAIINTLYIILLTLVIVLPLGVGAAVYLTEYATNRKLIAIIEFTNETLAGIPSIIYGLVGMLVFAQALGFQTSLLSGSLTLVIMTLPTIIRTTQESLKTVPMGYREGAMGLGAGKWHIIRTIVLPCSIDGIVTGCILAIGRIVGESAALLFTAGAAQIIANNIIEAYGSNGASLSVLLYLRAFENGDFDSAWGIGAILLVLVLIINIAARLAKKHLRQKG
ncbi:MAG TPA: phosphate ABC transporter permease PstA [Candidatus Faecalibacterium gallistercoris]|uniref:Phosphate transport system permease protein PstA n=1 Tax=Candidatus Faecalibacterium gallistercoris TaxID=2838579 RepID=A0A9D2FEM2_9FIRM|nr:phosphate ABC transporter permease PstA [Candidatus Faecalibacterium gallistercoris]